MDTPKKKLFLNRRCNLLQGGAPLSSSLHMGMDVIRLATTEDLLPLNLVSLPNIVLPDTPLHNAIGIRSLEMLHHHENSLQISGDGPVPSRGMGRESSLRLPGNGKKHDHSRLANLQRPKERSEGSGFENGTVSIQHSFWPSPSLQNPTSPTTDHLQQQPKKLYKAFHKSFQLPQPNSSFSFQNLHPSSSRMPLVGSPQSLNQNGILTLQGPQLPPPNCQQRGWTCNQNMQGPASTAVHNLQVSLPSAFYHPFLAPDMAARRLAVRSWGNTPLSVVDQHLWDIMEREKNRQWRGIELIASENFASQAVIEALGSHLTNKYSEGIPGARYFCGNEYIDQIENLCCERALEAFRLDPEAWGVNVQPYSCTSANFAVYTALLQPKDRIMELDSPSGGHPSRGCFTSNWKSVSGVSIFFESFPYKVNPQTGYIDFEKLEEKALEYRPKILICGGSAYPREWDYAVFRQIADKCGAILMCDMSHISGLIAAQECASPFDFCDIVTSTTDKILRGPRGGMVFYRKRSKQRRPGSFLYIADVSGQLDFKERINFSVFHTVQGGPHNNHIAALAVALKQVATPEYKAYIQQVKKNAQVLAAALQRRGCKLMTNGTDNHLLLWDLRPHGLTGDLYESLCEMCHMTMNKITLFGHNGCVTTGGVRIGTPAMTSRGCMEGDFEVIAEFLLKALHIASNVQREHGKINKGFLKGLQNNQDIGELRNNIEKFASSFEMPGVDVYTKKYNQQL